MYDKQSASSVSTFKHGGKPKILDERPVPPAIVKAPPTNRPIVAPCRGARNLVKTTDHVAGHCAPATLLISQGVHPKIVQERLGHSQISVTMDTYSHVLPTMQKEAADKLGAVIAG